MDYNYKLTIDLPNEDRNLFKDYLFKYHGMKPTIHFRGDTASITCHGYSIEEKSKNKNMIYRAIHDFHVFSLRKGIKWPKKN